VIIAFDFDGTVIDCQRRQVECMASIFRRAAMPFDGVSFWQLKREGRSTQQALEEMGFSPAKSDKMADEWASQVESPYWLGYDQPFEGVSDKLEKLTETRRVSLALITARKNEGLFRHQLRALGLAKFFFKKICVSPIYPMPAKAQVLREMMPFIYIGDTESDCQAAALANVRFAAVTSGQRSSVFLKKISDNTAEDIVHFFDSNEIKA